MFRIIILMPLGWAAGLLAYLAVLCIYYGQIISKSDLNAVIFWSALAYLLVGTAVYIPSLLVLKAILRGYRPIIVFPITTAILGVLPTALISFAWGGGVVGLFSSEAVLFNIFFSVAGAIVGLGFAWPRYVTS